MAFKFGDFAKSAADIFNVDYTTSGYQYKAKAKAKDGVVAATTTLQVFADPKTSMAPDKISMAFGKQMSFNGLGISKLELDKKGAINLEMSVDEKLHRIQNMTVAAKSKHVLDSAQATACLTYKFFNQPKTVASQACADVRVCALDKSEVEATVALKDKLAVGVKTSCEKPSKLSLAMRYGCPSAFVALSMKQSPNLNVEGHAFYNAKKMVEKNMKDLQFAVVCKHVIGGVLPTFGLGMLCKLSDECTLKAKVEKAPTSGPTVSTSAKFVREGCALLAGCKWEKKASFGLQFSIE